MTAELLWFLGTLVRPKLSAEETCGRLAVWEAVLPRGAEPPMHTHPQDETFYVLEGTVAVAGRTVEPGGVVFVPGGTPHAFRIESDTARLLFLSTPAGIEKFVRALSEPAEWPWLQPPADGPRVDPKRQAAVEREHGVIRIANEEER